MLESRRRGPTGTVVLRALGNTHHNRPHIRRVAARRPGKGLGGILLEGAEAWSCDAWDAEEGAGGVEGG